jgi:hypothetical protein
MKNSTGSHLNKERERERERESKGGMRAQDDAEPQCHNDSDKRPNSTAQLRHLRGNTELAHQPIDFPSNLQSPIPRVRLDIPRPFDPPSTQNRLELRTSCSNQRQPCGEPLPLEIPDGPNDPMSLTNPPSSGSISARARTTNLKRNLTSVDGKYLILGCCVACSLCWKA